MSISLSICALSAFPKIAVTPRFFASFICISKSYYHYIDILILLAYGTEFTSHHLQYMFAYSFKRTNKRSTAKAKLGTAKNTETKQKRAGENLTFHHPKFHINCTREEIFKNVIRYHKRQVSQKKNSQDNPSLQKVESHSESLESHNVQNSLDTVVNPASSIRVKTETFQNKISRLKELKSRIITCLELQSKYTIQAQLIQQELNIASTMLGPPEVPAIKDMGKSTELEQRVVVAVGPNGKGNIEE